MQRLTLLFLGLVIAWLGARLLGGAESFSPHLLRDALLLAAAGGLLFALNAWGWQPPPVFRRRRGLPRPGQFLLLTGLLVTLGGSLALALGASGVLGLGAAIAWWLGLLLQLGGAWWPGPAVDYAQPPVRWSRDAEGNIVSRPATRPVRPAIPPRRTLDGALSRRTALAWLLLTLFVAAGLRFWNLEHLPPGCIDQECAAALRLAQPQDAQSASLPGSLPLLDWLAGLLQPFTQSSVLSLRLAAAVLGWLTLLPLAGAFNRLARPPAALVALSLAALSPWHIWAGRSSEPGIATALLAAVTLWLGLEALARDHVRWWLPWGIAAGLLAVQAPTLWPGVTVWVLATGGTGLVHGLRRRRHVGESDLWQWPLAGLLAAAATALPAVYSFAGTNLASVSHTGASLAGANLASLVAVLVRPELSTLGPLVAGGLLNGLAAALAVGGGGTLLRHLRKPQALSVLCGTAALLLAAATLDLTVTPPAGVLLALLPLLFALTAAALDRVLEALVAAWGPPLAPAARLVTAAALAALLVAGRGAVALMLGLDAISSAGSAVEVDMARYVGEQVRATPAAPGATGDETTGDAAPAATFIVPPRVLDHPSVQLLGGSALAEGRLQALELGRTLPYTGAPAGDVVYLLPVLDTDLIDLLRQLYPTGEAATELDAAGARALFNRFTVRAADLAAAQTLQMTVTPADPAAATAFDQPLAVGAMDFPWSAAPPRALPFVAEWNGALVVPESGPYRVTVDSTGPESTFTLLLDDVLLLDSSLGLREQQQVLPQGIHRLQMIYRSGNQPGDLRVRWEAPDGTSQVLAAPRLHSPLLADQGLYGDYFANDKFEGAPAATAKDPVLGLDPGLPRPYSVRWYGLLAAPRAGEYLLGADAGGAVQLVVDGQTLADNRSNLPRPAAEGAQASTYTEGLIYLTAGWHPFEVRFVAGDMEGPVPGSDASTGAGAGEPQSGAPDSRIGPGELRLIWQPPGSDPSTLSPRYLLPAYGMVGPADAPMPPAPPIIDPMLGDDTFALTRASEVWQPHLRIPPADLPPLPLERLWQVGGVCGPAPEQLNLPHGLAFSPAGDRLYVADTGNRRVLVYSIDGALSNVITSEELQEPVDVATAPDGTVLVLDALEQQIFRLEGDGSLAAIPLESSFYRPRGLAVDDAGNLAVADTGGGRIVIVEPTGIQAGQFGGQGSLLGRGQPVDALATDGALWAISAEDGRLWNLTAGGSLTAVQPTGTIDGPQLAQLADGRIVATDPSRGGFVLFSPSGEPQGQFAYAGELLVPTGIAATRIGDGNIVAVADARACTVTLWRLAQ
jgi:sugar lactone lactonase YvrE